MGQHLADRADQWDTAGDAFAQEVDEYDASHDHDVQLGKDVVLNAFGETCTIVGVVNAFGDPVLNHFVDGLNIQLAKEDSDRDVCDSFRSIKAPPADSNAIRPSV